MSKFYTAIPVELKPILEAIKGVPGIHMDRLEFNKETNEIRIYWETDVFRSGYDHAVEFAQEFIRDKALPPRIKMDRNRMRLIQGLEPEPEVAEPRPIASSAIEGVSDEPAPPRKPAKPVQYDKDVNLELEKLPVVQVLREMVEAVDEAVDEAVAERLPKAEPAAAVVAEDQLPQSSTTAGGAGDANVMTDKAKAIAAPKRRR